MVVVYPRHSPIKKDPFGVQMRNEASFYIRGHLHLDNLIVQNADK